MANLTISQEEIWKDITGYEGHYQVSNFGRIKSVARKIKYGETHAPANKPEMILKPKQKNSGYLFVSLCKNNNIKYSHIHRLVASAFIPNPENKPLVNHIDGNKQNNSIGNLEWVTPIENIMHYQTKLKKGPKKHTRHKIGKHERRVIQLTLKGEKIKEWHSISAAAKHLKCNANGIGRVVNKRRGGKTCLGFKWEFADHS